MATKVAATPEHLLDMSLRESIRLEKVVRRLPQVAMPHVRRQRYRQLAIELAVISGTSPARWMSKIFLLGRQQHWPPAHELRIRILTWLTSSPSRT